MYAAHDKRSRELGRTILFLDVALSSLIFLAAFHIRNSLLPAGEALDFYAHIFLLPLLLALLLFFLPYFGAYRPARHTPIRSYAWSIVRAIALTVGTLLSLLFLLEIHYISRLVILLFAALASIALVLVRIWSSYYFKRAVKNGAGLWRILIVGTGERAKTMARTLRAHGAWGIRVVGHVDPDPGRLGGRVDDALIIGSVRNISSCLKNNVVDEVIIAIPRSLLEDTKPIIRACEEEGIKLQIMADLFDVENARVTFSVVGPIPLLGVEPVFQDEYKVLVKRLFDLVVTTTAMPLVLPLMAIIGLAIKVDSPGPILFVQQRVGLRKHPFRMLKFRSMCDDAEKRLNEIEHLNEAQGPIFKIRNDPRVTRVGAFLRKTSLDEIPQLLNVLRGEMSLVGPRPMSFRDVDLFDRGIQRKRFSVKPGITCLWQISGRSNLPFETWLKLDLEYIRTWSLWLDIKILIKTIPAVLFSRGAV
jgi:exopolysaccharide biosynthesis polyprenyl glycosylphosphotransferase